MVIIYGFIAITIMFVTYWLGHRSKRMVIFFDGGLAAAYSITVIEALWALVALRRYQEGRLSAGR